MEEIGAMINNYTLVDFYALDLRHEQFLSLLLPPYILCPSIVT
jgi:hypothetical protein